MAKKLFLLHLGPDSVDLSAMREGLALGRVAVPDTAAEVLDHAGTEIRRTHKAAGLKRKQVEGAWATVCRRAYKARADCFVSMPAFFGATSEQAALALDGVAGFKVVLVVTSGLRERQSSRTRSTSPASIASDSKPYDRPTNSCLRRSRWMRGWSAS